MQKGLSRERGGAVGVPRLDLPPLALGFRLVAGSADREPEVEPCNPAFWMRRDECSQACDAPVRPGGQGRPDRRLDGAGIRPKDGFERPQGGLALATRVVLLGSDELARVRLA